jgi:putative aldouronate transport system substrate-binding protein
VPDPFEDQGQLHPQDRSGDAPTGALYLTAGTNRRTFLSLIGLGVAATAGGGLLAACSREAGSEGAATGGDKIASVLPRYQQMQLSKPDIEGAIESIPDGYLKFPTELADAVAEKPGTSGATYRAIAPWWGPVPPGVSQNAYAKAVNAELGMTIDTSLQDGNTYADKLSAILGARDVPDLLVAPNWEVDKIARFADAVNALFEDLTPYLAGDKASAYPALAAFPKGSWEHSVWGGKLAAVPFPTDGPFAWAMFYRKDLFDAAGHQPPGTIEEFHEVGKAMTNAKRGVWAFGSIFNMVQMYYGVHGSTQGGWRKKADGGGLEHKYETPEYREALEFAAKVYAEGLVHPDVKASKGADLKALFKGGKIVMYEDGVGAWRGMQSEQSQVLKTFNMQPMPVFAAVSGRDPKVWGTEKPIFWTFVKKGIGEAKVKELLGALNYLASPFGTKEWQLREYGVEGQHFTRGADGSPVPTELGRREIGAQFKHLVGLLPAVVTTADTPNYVQDLLTYSNETVKYLEKELTAGIKLEMPAKASAVVQPTEDKILDILHGRRPVSDLDAIVNEWRSGGGDEARGFLEKALADNGR